MSKQKMRKKEKKRTEEFYKKSKVMKKVEIEAF